MEAAELLQLIEELETRVERLRSVYDQYFMGIERLEPLIMRKDVDRRLWILRREQIRNTGMRFKLQTTIQRYNTYQQYWARIVREIENGTYQRDLGRAAARFGENAVTAFGKRRQKMFERGLAKRAERDGARARATSSIPAPELSDAQQPASSTDGFDVAFDDSEVFNQPTPAPTAPLELDMNFGAPPEAVAPRARRSPATAPQGSPAMEPPRSAPTPRHGSFPPPPQAPRAPAPPAKPPPPPTAAATPARAPAARSRATPPAGTPMSPDGELSPTRLRQIYGQYVDAKRAANESTAAITYDKVAANLRETANKLRAKHNRNVDFEVVMRNGKPVLKPVVKS